MEQAFRSVAKALQTRRDIRDFLKSEEPIKDLFDLDLPIEKSRANLYRSLYNGVGNTPSHRVDLGNNNVLIIKQEHCNALGHNHYARFWLPYLFLAETFNVIKPSETKILEVTSGSAGISLAMACEKLDYHLTMIAPKLLPDERIQPIIDTGATLVRTDGYIDSCIEKLQEMKSEKYFLADHSMEASNFAVHSFSRIAVEYNAENGVPDYCVAGVGNGTSTEGIFLAIRRTSEQVKLLAYHPEPDGKQVVFGLYNMDVKLRHVPIALSKADKVFYTNGIDLTDTLKKFENDPIISNLGVSSLYGVALANILSQGQEGKSFMTVGYDTKDRYHL